MRASTKRILSIFISGVLFVATLVVYSNLIKPEIEKVGKNRALVFSKSEAFQDQKAAVLKVQDLISKLKEAKQLGETIALIMPQKPDITGLMGQLQTISRTSQAELKSFTIKPLPFESDEKPLVRRLGVYGADITVEGSYESVKVFLKSIETNVRIMNIDNFTIGPLGGAEKIAQDFYSAKISFKAFYQE